MTSQLTNKDFFFCYSPYLAKHIEKGGIKPITVAINPQSSSYFTMFADSDELTQLIEEYKSKREEVIADE